MKEQVKEICLHYLTLCKSRDDYTPAMVTPELADQILALFPQDNKIDGNALPSAAYEEYFTPPDTPINKILEKWFKDPIDVPCAYCEAAKEIEQQLKQHEPYWRVNKMDRLLSEQEQAGLIWELSAAIEGSEGRQPTQEEMHDYLLKAQDDLTAHLVAQEIFKDLDHLISTCYTDHIQEYYAIKSKRGIE